MNEEDKSLYNDKSECCGCMACYAVCPVNAIIIIEDSEGFLYPKIDINKCISCNLCVLTCNRSIASTFH